MTKRDEHEFSRNFGSGRRRRLGALVAVIGGACGVATLVQACGGSDLSCGKGTEKKGSECVANSSLQGGGGSSEGGVEPSGSGGRKSTGGGTGTGGARSGSGGKSNADGGNEPAVEKFDFAGITSASAANQTPPKATGAVADSIRITWNPAKYPARPLATIHYEIFEAESAGTENFAVPLDTAPPGSTSTVIQDRDPAKTYYYAVRAVADVGTAKDTNTAEASATPLFDDTPPDFPAGATGAEPAGPTSMTVSWTAATDDHTDSKGIVYRVYWTDKAGGNLTLGAVSLPGAESVVVTGLPAPKTDYYFRAVAVDAAGNVDNNHVDIRGTTGADDTPPVFGGCASVSDLSASTAKVTWNPAFDDTSLPAKITYVVYASDVHLDRGQLLKGLEVGRFTGATGGQVSDLNSATLYRFVCRAEDESGNADDNLVIQTGATSNDGQAPTFGGLVTAVASQASTEPAVDLTWVAGSDDQTATKDIKYRVYASITKGGEDFSAEPTAISAAGVTAMTLSKANLLRVTDRVSNTPFYFVVRAADGAGNVDKNTNEIAVTTLVSFTDDIQPIFNNKCAILGCHTTADPAVPPKQGQNLDEGAAYLSIVNVTAVEGQALGTPNLKRVSTSGVLIDSYMYRKVTNTAPITGSTMPPAASLNGPLDMTQQSTLILWIQQGAKQN